MQFGLAFGYFINRTGGFTNVLLLTLCQLIPVVGPIAMMGYRAEVAVSLLDDPELRRHSRFDFNRFGDYLTRGVWPFLIALVLSVPFVLVIWGVMIVSAVIGGVANNNPGAGFLIAIPLFVAGLIVMTVLSVPMTFHAELVNKFDFMGGLQFATRFWSLVGVSAIVTALLFIPLALGISIVGLLCCIIGIYPASTVVQMASQHLLVQLYQKYLERGGEPIPEFRPPNRPALEERNDHGDRDRNW